TKYAVIIKPFPFKYLAHVYCHSIYNIENLFKESSATEFCKILPGFVFASECLQESALFLILLQGCTTL
ncbi:MAG: hypothetical protein ACOCUR_02630, partial [Nanoarchaeota archaeon]